MAAALEQFLAKAVEENTLPQAVVFATNGSGSFTYNHAVGNNALNESGKPVNEDSVFLLASCTKLMTSIAALQVVEKGLVTLDEDLSAKMPDLATKQILEGFDADDKPIYRQRSKPLTLRILLTHTSGIPYDSGDPRIIKLREQQGKPPNWGLTVADRGGWPLLFEPGAFWMYGMGLDWAGRLVETLTGLSLEDYMRKNIWEPLGCESFTFFPDKHPSISERIVSLSLRTPKGKSPLVHRDGPFITTDAVDAFGGHGSYGSIKDYVKILQSLLADDGRLLKPETVAEMFKPQLGPKVQRSLDKVVRLSSMGSMFIGEFSPDVPMQHGLGGVVFLEDDKGKRRKGTMNWGGVCNTFWIIDREADIAIAFGTQLLPPGDRPAAAVISEIERAVYKMAGKVSEDGQFLSGSPGRASVGSNRL